MSRRVIEACLLAYPRGVRRRDRNVLRDLALALADDHGVLREAFGLLRGGLAERRRQSRTGRAAVAGAAVTLLASTVLTWTVTAQSGLVEEDLFVCEGHCADVTAKVSSRVRDGWSCTERRDVAGASWRCVID